MAKVYSWYLYTHSQQGEQYGYIIHPDDAAKLLLINNANSAITNHNDVRAYTGNRLSGEDLTNIKKWTKKCSNNDYEAMFNRLTSLVKEGNPDTNLGQYTDYNNVVGVIDDLRGPRGRGVKKIELWTTGTTENTYRIIFDDGSTDYFQMPRPRDGRDGRDGAAADLPVLQITKTLYASGLKNGEVETPNKPSGGVFDFAEGKLSDVDGNGSNWYETNSNLTPPIFSSSAIFFSTDGQSKDGWTNPLQITGDDGKPGTDGNSTEFIYRLAESAQQPNSDDLLCYKGSFEYYQWDNNANKYLPIDRKPIADSVKLKTELPSNKDGEYIKMWYKPIDLSKDNSVEKNDDSIRYDSEEDCLKNSNGIQPEIANVKYIKRINNNTNEYYIWGEYIDEYVPNNWTDSPSGVDDSNKTEYCSTRRRNSKTKKWGAWSTPQIWAKYGEKGEDGDGVEYIFFLGDGTQPLNPTPSNYQQNEDYQSKDAEWLPSSEKNPYQNIDGDPVDPSTVNWEDEAKSVTPEMMYLWVSSRKFRNGEWGPFSKPSLWAKYGESGKSAYIIREIYCMNDSTDTVPELPNDAKNLINWSVGFPTDYQSGKVVWGSKAEVDGDTGDFIRLYTIKQGTPEDSILEINTVICSEFPSTSQEVEINGKPCKYIYYNDKYFKYDGGEYVELKDSPKDALKSDDRKFIVLNELPSTRQFDYDKNAYYELVKVNNTYYRWNTSTKKYHAQEGIPTDVQLYNIKGINTIQRDTLPVHNTGYLYIIYNGEYYEWKETCWSTPYLVTGLRGAPAAPVDRTVDFFCYYSVDSTPNKPDTGITITDGTNEITGMTENGIVDKWKRTPALAPNESTSLRRWYRCTGYVKGETQTVQSWGDVSPASGVDGEDGYSYEMRYCVTYTVNPPSLNNTETKPTYETNGQITGWFSLENAEEYRQYQDLLIDGCPPMGGAIWKIQARKNGNGEIEGNWSNPERVSGYPGEKGLEGPAGRRGVTGIPGATLNPLYCLGTYYENNINTPGSFYDEVKENLLDYNDFLFGKTILENNLVSQENSILSNKLKLEVNKTYTFTDIPVYSSVSNKLYIAKFNDLNQYLGCDEITPESIVNNYAIAQYTPQNSSVAFYRLLLQSGYNSAVTFDSTVAKIFNKNSETKYYRNGYFGETPVIEPNNDKLKNWFTSPPDTEHIVVNSEAELENAIKYDKLGRVIDYKVVDIEGGYSFITHNYYSVIETSIPIDSNNDNTYHYIYNSNNDINKGNQEINGIVYVFIAEHCYYQWDDNKNAYELINVSNNRPIVTESVKNVTRIPTAKCIDFDYVKKTVYYKWNDNNTMFEVYDMPFNAGNYKLDKQVICENVSGDDEIKKWTTYIWSTQGTKQEVYANTYSYMSGETAYTGETIPSMVNDINVGLSEIQPSDLTTKDSRYKYLKYNNKYYQWSDSLRTYTIYSMTKTPSDIMTDVTRSNTIEYAPDGNAQRININGSDFEFGVLEIPTFNLTNCEYLKQTINNVTYYYAFDGQCYRNVTNSLGPIIPSDATRDNTLIVTPGTTISLLNKVNQQYKYFKEEHQRYNPNVNDDIGTNNETYYVYYSWEDTPNELLETQVNQINWCTPFRIQGINGLATAGNRGQILYPMGVYNENEVYRTTTTKAPYVLDPNDGLFYVYNIVDIPWVGVQPLNFREITEAPSDITSSNTLDVDSDFIPNWYQKYYDCIQKYGYYEWDEDENRYINLCIPSDARENNTKVIGENDSITNKIEGFDYILFEGKYYEWTDNGYRPYFDENDINDKPIYAVDSIGDNLYTEEEHYLLYSQHFYEWDSNENRYKEVTSENIYFNLFQKDVPNSKSFANRIKVYFNYSWNGNSKSYKPTALANAKTSVHVLPTEKIGYNYFRITTTDSNGVNKTYLKWDFNKNQLVNASIYKYSADGTGAEGSWILAQGDGGLTTPATNYANAIANNTQPAWVRFEHFDALYASIGIIANGMVGSAVFNNEFMFSQQGKVLNSDKTKRVNGSEYEKFLSAYVFDANKGSNGAWTFKGNVVSDTSVDPYNEANEFHPNVCINFKTGQMWLSCGKIKLGAFAINGDDDSEDNNITTKDIISEWGADNILTPQERATLSDTFKAFEVEYEETFGCYTAITGNINGGELTILKNAYDKASSAFTAHITSTAKEVDTLPIEQEGNLLYLKYHNHFYKWGNIPDGGIYRYDEYKINVEVDFYENLPSASNRNTIAYVSGDTINNDGSNEVLHYSGYYVKTDDGWTKLSAEIVKSIPLNIGEISPNYIIVNTDFKSDGVLYEKTGLTQGQAYILADYQNNIDIDNKNTRIFTSGDTMVIYDDEDSENRSYNNILNYYKVRKDLNISVNDSIKTAIATAQSSANTANVKFEEVSGKLENWAADGMLSPMEIKGLKDEYEQFKAESGLTLNHALLVTNSAITATTHIGNNIYTTYTGACANANTAFIDHTNKPEGNNSIKIANNYNNIKLYYSARLNLSDFIEKYLNDNANERIDSVNERIDNSIQVITGASKDNRIYEGESYKIKQEYENFEYVTATTESNFKIALGINDINDIPEDWQDEYTAYTGACESANTAFKYYSEFSGDKLTADTLGVYYIPVIIGESNNSYTHIYNYYTAETAFNAVINRIIKSNIDDADSDANRALGALGVTSSDGVITFNELPSLKEMKMQIESESASTIAMAEETNNEALEGIITDYSSTTVSALAVLDHYINAVTEQIDKKDYTGVNIVYENQIGDDGTIITYCDYDLIAEYYKKKVELLSEIQKITNQSYADLNNKVTEISHNTTDINFLTKAFSNGQTYTDGGLILSNFIGVTDGNETENNGYGFIRAFMNASNNFYDDQNGRILFASGVNGNGQNEKFYKYLIKKLNTNVINNTLNNDIIFDYLALYSNNISQVNPNSKVKFRIQYLQDEFYSTYESSFTTSTKITATGYKYENINSDISYTFDTEDDVLEVRNDVVLITDNYIYNNEQTSLFINSFSGDSDFKYVGKCTIQIGVYKKIISGDTECYTTINSNVLTLEIFIEEAYIYSNRTHMPIYPVPYDLTYGKDANWANVLTLPTTITTKDKDYLIYNGRYYVWKNDRYVQFNDGYSILKENIDNIIMCDKIDDNNNVILDIIDLSLIEFEENTTGSSYLFFKWSDINGNSEGSFIMTQFSPDKNEYVVLPVTSFAKTCIFENGVISTRRLEAYDKKRGLTGNFTGNINADGTFTGTMDNGIININDSSSSINMYDNNNKEIFKIVNEEIPKIENKVKTFTCSKHSYNYNYQPTSTQYVVCGTQGIAGTLGGEQIIRPITLFSTTLTNDMNKIIIPPIDCNFTINNSPYSSWPVGIYDRFGTNGIYVKLTLVFYDDYDVLNETRIPLNSYEEGNMGFYLIRENINVDDSKKCTYYFPGEIFKNIPKDADDITKNKYSKVKLMCEYLFVLNKYHQKSYSTAIVQITPKGSVTIEYGDTPSMFMIGNDGLYYYNADKKSKVIIRNDEITLGVNKYEIKINEDGIVITGTQNGTKANITIDGNLKVNGFINGKSY